MAARNLTPRLHVLQLIEQQPEPLYETAIRIIARSEVLAIENGPKGWKTLPGHFCERDMEQSSVRKTFPSVNAPFWNCYTASVMQVSELCGARLDNLNLAKGYLHVIRRGSKKRIVPVRGSAKDALVDWLAIRQKHLTRLGFLSSSTGDRLPLQRISQLVKQHCRYVVRILICSDILVLHTCLNTAPTSV
jgi:hypothetical protein